jgi:hypothetical protein
VLWTIERTGRTLNIGGTTPLPPGTPIDEVVEILRFTVGRHQSLRTRYRTTPDGTVQQVVSDSGEIPVEIVDVADGADPDEVAEALRARYENTPFEYAEEWPVRTGVVCRDGVPTHAVVMYCHLAVDGGGIEAMLRDLANLDRATGRVLGPPAPAVQPLELAAHQASPSGRRQSEHALRHWERQLRSIPARTLGGSGDRRTPRFWCLHFRSPAMRQALYAVATRHHLQTGHLLLATHAIALARVTGSPVSVAQVLVNNRFRPGLADSVSQLTQVGLCAIEVADSTFDEVAVRAYRSAMSAYKNGYYSTVDHQALIARVNQERGEDVDIWCFVNDLRGQFGEAKVEPSGDGAGITPDALRAALALSEFEWGAKQDQYDGTLYLHIHETRTWIGAEIWADTHRLSPADIQAYARGLEAVLVEAALDPAASTGVTAKAVAV